MIHFDINQKGFLFAHVFVQQVLWQYVFIVLGQEARTYLRWTVTQYISSPVEGSSSGKPSL